MTATTRPTDFTKFYRVDFTINGGKLTKEGQDAMVELQRRLGGVAGIIYAVDVASVPAGSLAATDVQAALDELDFEKQTKDATLTALAGVVTAADKLIYATGSDVFTTTTFTAFARTLLDDVDAAAARATLVLGTLATQNGTFSGTSSGTNTGDQTITLTGDVTGSGTGSFAATVGSVGGKAVSLAGSLTTAGAFASTFTMTNTTAVTFPTSGTLATLAGSEVFTSKTLTAPVINNPTGTVTLASGTLGYATGNGGQVTQLTDKSTTVVLNKIAGEVTMDAATLNAGTTVTFTLTNSTISQQDVLILNHVQAGTAGAYTLNAQPGPGSVSINVRNVTAGNLSEAIVIRFAVIKSAVA